MDSASPSKRLIVEEAACFIDKLQEEIKSLKANAEVVSTTRVVDGNVNLKNIFSHAPSGISASLGEQPAGECSTQPAELETESDEPIDRNTPYWSSNHIYTIISDPEPYELYPQLYLPISPSARRVQRWYMPILPGVTWLR
ncbi:hypothetical protein PM082_009815 [Marasmius tenuissimus]|nr:hypothetical protein PM082_009815 [Marasmius tenuissimus]